MRYLAIDLGDKRTGLALGDPVTRLVTPVGVVESPISARGGEQLLDDLARAIHDQIGEAPRDLGQPTAALVIGLPLNMDDTEGPRARLVRAFAARLAQRTGFAVQFQDERLTSAEADWSMARTGLTRKEKKQRRDAIAAAAILRSYLDTLARMD